jgi:hypothetical protein
MIALLLIFLVLPLIGAASAIKTHYDEESRAIAQWMADPIPVKAWKVAAYLGIIALVVYAVVSRS